MYLDSLGARLDLDAEAEELSQGPGGVGAEEDAAAADVLGGVGLAGARAEEPGDKLDGNPGCAPVLG
jgi:hypothetical protein